MCKMYIASTLYRLKWIFYWRNCCKASLEYRNKFRKAPYVLILYDGLLKVDGEYNLLKPHDQFNVQFTVKIWVQCTNMQMFACLASISIYSIDQT